HRVSDQPAPVKANLTDLPLVPRTGGDVPLDHRLDDNPFQAAGLCFALLHEAAKLIGYELGQRFPCQFLGALPDVGVLRTNVDGTPAGEAATRTTLLQRHGAYYMHM